jgi:plasmid stabilization system protein ParE
MRQQSYQKIRRWQCGETACFVVPGFPNYVVFYQLFQEIVSVIRVLHAARDWTRFSPAV